MNAEHSAAHASFQIDIELDLQSGLVALNGLADNRSLASQSSFSAVAFAAFVIVIVKFRRLEFTRYVFATDSRVVILAKLRANLRAVFLPFRQ